MTQLMIEHARQIEQGRYRGDDGTVEVHAAAMQHLVHTSRSLGVAADLPDLLQGLLDRSIAAGYAQAGIASAVEVIRSPAASSALLERRRS